MYCTYIIRLPLGHSARNPIQYRFDRLDMLTTTLAFCLRLRFTCPDEGRAMGEDALWGTYDEALAACDGLLSTWVGAIDATLAEAVQGDRLASRSYATSYVDLVDFVASTHPGDSHTRTWLARVARREAVSLPFRACVVEGRVGVSVVMTLLSDMRHMAPGTSELVWPTGCASRLHSRLTFDDRGVQEFERVVDRIVDGSVSPLEEVIGSFDLSYTDAGRLFGVTRQAVSQWLAEGVPTDRRAKVTTVAQIAALLDRYLVSERIPGIARKPAEQYGGRSMLEMVESDEHLELLEITRRSFDWASTA